MSIKSILEHGNFKIVQREDNMCVACLENKATLTCIPCAHETLCKKCSKLYMTMFTNCPICRQDFNFLVEMEQRK
jgi:hypothetical protein